MQLPKRKSRCGLAVAGAGTVLGGWCRRVRPARAYAHPLTPHGTAYTCTVHHDRTHARDTRSYTTHEL